MPKLQRKDFYRSIQAILAKYYPATKHLKTVTNADFNGDQTQNELETAVEAQNPTAIASRKCSGFVYIYHHILQQLHAYRFCATTVLPTGK